MRDRIGVLRIRRVILRINGVIGGGVTGGERWCGCVRGLVMINRRVRVRVRVRVLLLKSVWAMNRWWTQVGINIRWESRNSSSLLLLLGLFC